MRNKIFFKSSDLVNKPISWKTQASAKFLPHFSRPSVLDGNREEEILPDFKCDICCSRILTFTEFKEHSYCHEKEAEIRYLDCEKVLPDIERSDHSTNPPSSYSSALVTTIAWFYSTQRSPHSEVTSRNLSAVRTSREWSESSLSRAMTDENHRLDAESPKALCRRPCDNGSPLFEGIDSSVAIRNHHGLSAGTGESSESSLPPAMTCEVSGLSCPACGRRLSCPASLRKHARMFHGGEQQRGRRRCPHCPYRCFQSSDLQKHVARRHTRDFRHKCPLCPKGFAVPKELDVHLKRHRFLW